jgi:hypothetical protein
MDTNILTSFGEETLCMTLDEYRKTVNEYITDDWNLDLINSGDIDQLMLWEEEEIIEAWKISQCPIEIANKINTYRN